MSAKSAFRVGKRFDPGDGEAWNKYIQWSGLTHVTDIVGLDASLCPAVFEPSTPADWDRLVYGEEIGNCFDDADYLAERVADCFDARKHQFLAVAREASEGEIKAVRLPGFVFKGFELLDNWGSTSALTNCGGFPEAFESSELSPCGLIESATRAYEIRRTLAIRYPKEPHAQCVVWALWLRVESPASALPRTK